MSEKVRNLLDWKKNPVPLDPIIGTPRAFWFHFLLYMNTYCLFILSPTLSLGTRTPVWPPGLLPPSPDIWLVSELFKHWIDHKSLWVRPSSSHAAYRSRVTAGVSELSVVLPTSL